MSDGLESVGVCAFSSPENQNSSFPETPESPALAHRFQQLPADIRACHMCSKLAASRQTLGWGMGRVMGISGEVPGSG
jgi:hypothetical protein